MTRTTSTTIFHRFTLGVIALLILPSLAFGQLTFHDGVMTLDGGTLTAAGGGTPFDAIDLITPGDNVTDDGLWRIRGDILDAGSVGNRFGAAGTVFEASNEEDAAELVQTIQGLGSGASVDVYVVWWSDPSNWNIRAGFSSNPGGNQLYDRTGANGEAGTLGVFANWASLPPDNPDIMDDFTGVEAATLEGNRTMLIAKIGTGTADGSGNLPVYIDDNFGGSDRSWFDGLATAPVGSNVNALTATIDRTTGNLSLNSSNDVNITSLSITSGSGSLNAGNWNSITGNLDGAGSATFDADDNWEITSSTSQNLAENEITDPAPIAAGGTLGPSGAGTIDFGNVWTASPFEDVAVNLTLGSGFTVPVAVTFTGGSAQVLGDFDNDTDIDVDDYAVVLNGLNQDLGGLTDVESYPLGDINGDQVTNFQDLVDFRDAYDGVNGAGAFAALVASVPEPTSFALMAMATLGIAFKRRGRALALMLVVTLVCRSSAVQAQTITYVDADHTSNTVPETPLTGDDTFPFGAIDDQNNGEADGLWDLRTFSNGGTIYQNRGFFGGTVEEGAEDAHRLITTISGLTDGTTYEIYAYFWSDGNPWKLNAGLSNGALPSFNNTNTDAAVLEDFVDPLTLVSEGNRTLYQAVLGEATAGPSGEVAVYIDDNDPLMTMQQERTWYDGVGYAIAGPKVGIQVNTTTGEIKILNPTGDPVDFSYYEISSGGSSLNPASWNSLDAQNIDAVDGNDPGSVAGDSLLEGWDIAGGGGSPEGDYDGSGTVDAADLTTWQGEYPASRDGSDFLTWQQNLGESGGGAGGSAGLLNETNLLNETTLAAVTGELSLGNAFDTSVGAQDLLFRFGTVDDGEIRTGRVTYVSSASAAAAVPEPTAMVLLGSSMLLLAASRRRK